MGYDTTLRTKIEKIFHGNAQIIDDDTTEIIKQIFHNYGITLPQNNHPQHTINWKKVFQEKMNITFELQLISTIHFLNRLKIAVEKIDSDIIKEYNNIRDCITSEKKMILEYHLTANSQYYLDLYGDTRLDKLRKDLLQTRRENNAENILIRKDYNNTDKMLELIQNNANFLDYEKGAIMSDYMKLLKYSILLQGSPTYLSFITELLTKLNQINVGNTIELVLYAALLRYNMVVETLNTQKASKYFYSALEMYYDIGNLEGAISTYFDKALVTSYINPKFHLNDMKEFEKGRQLCDVIGSYRYMDKLKFLCKQKE
jgi:hypothetical protein